jgi:arsenate reductase
MTFLPEISVFFNTLTKLSISKERKGILNLLINYITEKQAIKEEIKLIFICTHNSRRSQFAHVWATVAAYFYGIEIACYSGGTEISAFNKRAIATLIKSGFRITKEGIKNPIYSILFSEGAKTITAFSKPYDSEFNPNDNFAAIMTCSHADANCPYIPGAEKRISIQYEDPKEFDGFANEEEEYYKRSTQIASEMFYVFSKI